MARRRRPIVCRRQFGLFGDTKNFPSFTTRRLGQLARVALQTYANAGAPPGERLGELARLQARLQVLRQERKRLATQGGGRLSKIRLAEWVITPEGARVERAMRRLIQRIEALEAGLSGRG